MKETELVEAKKKQISIKSWSKDPQSVQCLWSFLQREEMRGRISLLSAFFTVLMILANLLPTKITLFDYFFLDVKKNNWNRIFEAKMMKIWVVEIKNPLC